MRHTPHPRRRAFTLIELTLALAITALVTVQVLAILSTQLETYVAQSRVIEIQNDARLAADMVRRDARMAGFLLPQEVGLSSRDGGPDASDVLCASDWTRMNEDQLETALERFDAAELTLDAAADELEVEVSTLDIDGDGTDDFVVGEGIIISAGLGSHCARIAEIDANVVRFEPATPAGFVALATAGVAAPAVVYEVTSTGLTRNGQLLSTLVEDMQVQFAVDTNADGQITGAEFPVDTLALSDPGLVRGLELTILTRTPVEDPALTGPGRQQIANRQAAGSPDSFRRRHTKIRIAPRNML
jgi:Tfp pilus assembly protein PilW